MKDAFPRRIRLIKASGQSTSSLPAYLEREGWEIEPPTVGKRYFLLQDTGRIFRTGLITKVHKDGFDTENSRYRIEVLHSSRERLLEGMDDTVDLTCIPRKVTIRCLDGSTIHGKVNLKHENRVSDVFIKGDEPFVVIFDAAVKGALGKILVLNKNAIAWVSVEE